MFCIDASVFISAARVVEQASKGSQAFLNLVKEKRAKVLVPEILIPEITSGLFHATENPSFSLAFTRSLRSLPNLSFIPIDGKLADLAAFLITQSGLRSADALYIAVSLEYGLTLVSLDKDQLAKGKKFIKVIQPFAEGVGSL